MPDETEVVTGGSEDAQTDPATEQQPQLANNDNAPPEPDPVVADETQPDPADDAVPESDDLDPDDALPDEPGQEASESEPLSQHDQALQNYKHRSGENAAAKQARKYPQPEAVEKPEPEAA